MTATPSNEHERARVLIVDDLPANLGVLLTCLHDAGYEVLVATGGDKALARLEQMQPDLILLDVNMPGLDGYETCRRLKADPRWRDVPVLFLTALGEPVDKMQGFAVGAVDYIAKPLHPGEVLARVRAHLKILALQRLLKEKNETLEEKNALLEAAMAWRLETETQLQQSLDRAVVVVDAQGTVGFCTRLARQFLERYFPGHTDPATLPGPLTDWLVGDGPVTPWCREEADRCLEVQRFTSDQSGAPLMLLLAERVVSAGSPARLLALGLTAREAEVLFWVAHGKSNQEVADILQTSLGTIKKHMVNILFKTGLETRLIAGLHAAELLGLGGSRTGRSHHETGPDRAEKAPDAR